MLLQVCANLLLFCCSLHCKGLLLVSLATGREMVIISGKALWKALSLKSLHYRRVVPSSWKWASWSSWVKSSVAEVGSCHRWILPLSKATSAICSAEPVPWRGKFCLSLCKHRAGCGLPKGGLPGWNCSRLWSPLSWAGPEQEEGSWISGDTGNASTSDETE